MRPDRRAFLLAPFVIVFPAGSADARRRRHGFGYGGGSVKFSWAGVLVAAGMLAGIGLLGFLEHGKNQRYRRHGRGHQKRRLVHGHAKGVLNYQMPVPRLPRRGILGRWNLWLPLVVASCATGIIYLPNIESLPIRLPFLSPAPAMAGNLSICSGGDRKARKVTCIIDGDTGWEHGVKWRYAAIDAPEMAEHASCRAEVQKAFQARDRLRELMSAGYRVNWSGRKGSFHRSLVTITLSDGRDAGDVLLNEGLAQPWPNQGNVWCGN